VLIEDAGSFTGASGSVVVANAASLSFTDKLFNVAADATTNQAIGVAFTAAGSSLKLRHTAAFNTLPAPTGSLALAYGCEAISF